MVIYGDAINGKPPADFDPLVDRYDVGSFAAGDFGILRILTAHLGADVAEDCRKAAIAYDVRGKGYLSWTHLLWLARYVLADIDVCLTGHGWYSKPSKKWPGVC